MTDPAVAIALPLVADFEGFRAEPYQDIAGIWTIGYGRTFNADGSHVTARTPATTRAAEDAILMAALIKTVATVRAMTSVPLTVNQAAALASLAYNIGSGALRRSTLIALVGRGDFAGAAGQFAVWIYAGGRMSQGLVGRRKVEAALFVRVDGSATPTPAPAPAPPQDEANRLMDQYD